MSNVAVSKPRVGIIGLGSAGSAMAKALSENYQLTLFDLDSAACKKFELEDAQTMRITETVQELAASVDVIVLCLPTPEASLAAVNGIGNSVRKDTLVIESSTVRPEDVDALQEILKPSGATVVDAAIIGGVHNLEAGKAVFLVGGAEDAVGVAAPVLRSISAEIFFLQKQGDGMRAKLVANAVSHTTYVLLLEAGALAAAQNIPMSVFTRLMERESGLLRPLTHRFEGRFKEKDFSGGMSTANARKDSGLILDTARDLGVPLFAISAAHSAYELAVAEGLGSSDYASMGQLWEKWLDIRYFPDD